MAKRKGLKWNQKNQKNMIAGGAALVGATAITLATHPQWKVPAAGAKHLYATVHDKVGDFANFVDLGPGPLLLIGVVGFGIFGWVFRK